MLSSFRLGRAILAGLMGTFAMTVLMYGWPLVGLPRMDILAALGGVFPFDLSPYLLGSVIHFGIGISLAVAYVLLFDPWLRGPGWLRGTLFSLLPWLFAVTLLGPSLVIATEFFKGKPAAPANPCSVANPCAVQAANPCAPPASNPCAAKLNPCAPQNPCAVGNSSASVLPPQVMSLIAHLVYGAVLGAAYGASGSLGKGLSLLGSLLRRTQA